MTIDIPTKTDDSIGRVKADRPTPPGFERPVDLRYDVPAAEWERIKDSIIANATAMAGLELGLGGEVFEAKLTFTPGSGEVVVRVSDYDNTTDNVPKVSLALATQTYITSEPMALLLGKVGGGSMASGDLVYCARVGWFSEGVIGGGVAGDAVYVNDAGKLATTVGTHTRRVGKIVLVVSVGDPGSKIVEFDGELGGAGGVGSATAPLVVTGSDVALAPASQANGDLLTRIAGVWSRLGLGTLGYSLLAGASGPGYGVPQPKITVQTGATYTTAATDELVVGAYASGSMTVTLDSSVPTSGFGRRVVVFYSLSSGSLTVKDPGGSTLAILDGTRVASVEVFTPDGTNWAVADREALNLKQYGVFIGRMATGVTVGTQGSCCYQSGRDTSEPEFTAAVVTSGSTATDNPLVLALATVDGGATANHKQVYFLARGFVTGYDVAGSPAAGAAVFVATGGRLSTSPGTARRQVGWIVAGSSTSWDVWFDGSFVPASSLAFGATDARGDLITRGATKYGRLALGLGGQKVKSDGTDVVWGYDTTRTLSGTSDTIALTDENLFVPTTGGNFTLTVPATAPGAGWKCWIQKITADANTITFARGSFTGKIQGAAADFTSTVSSSPGFPYWLVVSDGTDLWVR